MAELPANYFDSLTTPYQVLRVDNIPIDITLRNLADKVEPLSRHIIGLARTADYTAKRLGTTVYYICTSLGDAEFLQEQFIDFVEDGRDAQRLTIVDSVVGRASLPNANYVNQYERVPVTVYLKGFQRIKEREGFTDYLRDFLPHFETSGTVTSFRLGYDVKKKYTRNDGYVTFLNQAGAREVAGEVQPKIHSIYGTEIEAVLSPNVPVIMRIPESHRLEGGKAEWSEEIETFNQLMIHHNAPFVHPREDELDVHSGEIPLQQLVFHVAQNPDKAAEPTASTSGAALVPPFIRPLSKPLPIPTESDDALINRLSTTAVYNDKDGGAISNKNRIVLNVSNKKKRLESSSSSSSSSSDEDENRLVINEDVQLDTDADMQSASRI